MSFSQYLAGTIYYPQSDSEREDEKRRYERISRECEVRDELKKKAKEFRRAAGCLTHEDLYEDAMEEEIAEDAERISKMIERRDRLSKGIGTHEDKKEQEIEDKDDAEEEANSMANIKTNFIKRNCLNVIWAV